MIHKIIKTIFLIIGGTTVTMLIAFSGLQGWALSEDFMYIDSLRLKGFPFLFLQAEGASCFCPSDAICTQDVCQIRLDTMAFILNIIIWSFMLFLSIELIKLIRTQDRF